MGALTFETCCFPEPEGNAFCWDQYYNAARCCVRDPPVAESRSGEQAPAVSAHVGLASAPQEAPAGGCEMDLYQSFKAGAARWYNQKATRLAMFHELTTVLSHFDTVFDSCPSAALTALLLKLESIYFDDDQRFYDLLDVYLKHEHRAVSEGKLLQSHHQNGWPLLGGVNRVLELRALGRRPKPVGRSRATVDLVVCFCAERLVWLRGFHKLPWREEDRSWAMRKYVSLKIYHKCPASTDQERDVERRRLLKDWSEYFESVVVRYVDDAVRADDCSAYLQYIVDYYGDLPEFTIFLHADAPEHIPSLELLTDTAFAASRHFLPEETGFAHLSHNHVLNGCEGRVKCEAKELDGYEFPTLWKQVFGSSIAPSLAAGELAAYCCVQFLVRNDRIRLRPLDFYARALAYLGSTPESYYRLFPVGKVVRMGDALGRTPCQLSMYIWHAMFGEPLRLPRRQHDVNLPLFMKVVNIEVEALGEEIDGNDPIIDQMVHTSFEQQSGPHSTWARVGSLFEGSTDI